MKLGYFTMTHNPPGYAGDRQDPNQILEDTLTQCLYAEELGFNSVWVPYLRGLLQRAHATLCGPGRV